MLKFTLLILFFFTGQLCMSIDDSGKIKNNKAQIAGILYLSGEETSRVGTSLSVANIEVANTALTGTDKSVVLLSNNITVKNNELVFDESNQNGFVIVASDFSTGGSPNTEKTLSINIVKNGQEYLFACSSPFRKFFIACGKNYVVDFEAKTVIFENTTVINTDNNKILTLDGSISWQ